MIPIQSSTRSIEEKRPIAARKGMAEAEEVPPTMRQKTRPRVCDDAPTLMKLLENADVTCHLTSKDIFQARRVNREMRLP